MKLMPSLFSTASILDHTNTGKSLICIDCNLLTSCRSECCKYIVNCDDPIYGGYGTYSKAVFAYVIAQLNGKTMWLEPIEVNVNKEI